MKRYQAKSYLGTMLKSVSCAAALFSTLGSLAAQVPQPTLFYDFDSSSGEGNEYVSSVGSSGSLDLRTFGYEGERVWRHSLTDSGFGVSGRIGDRALDLSGATGMGGTDNFGGGASTVGGLDSVAGFHGAQSLTIAGWIYASEESLRSNAQIVNLSNASENGFRLSGANTGKLQFNYVGEHGRDSFTTSDNTWGAVGEWMFFAIVVDTTIESGDNLHFYSVDSAGDLVVERSFRSDLGALQLGEDISMTIGNWTGSATNRPFQGYIDNLGFWADADGADGALTMEQLDAFRMTSIPEPGFYGALVGFVVAAGVVLRRSRSQK